MAEDRKTAGPIPEDDTAPQVLEEPGRVGTVHHGALGREVAIGIASAIL